MLRSSKIDVGIPAWIASAGFFARMSEGTLGPVMRPPACTTLHLELIHAELVAGVRVNGAIALAATVNLQQFRVVIVVLLFIRRQVTAQGHHQVLEMITVIVTINK